MIFNHPPARTHSRRPLRLAVSVALLALCGEALCAIALAQSGENAGYATEPVPGPVQQPANNTSSSSSVLVYDRDYPFMHYASGIEHNDVARMQERIKDGSLKLTPTPQHGYLESVLSALKINPDSQVLVFSKTSLQVDAISEATPRAIYFNDDTYVAWVQKTGMLEIVTMDAERGPVFYTMYASDPRGRLQRETLRCLTCHDSYSEMGGGVPHFLFDSVYELQGGNLLPDSVARETTDETPIAQRWGGWYVTGKDGGAPNLGNIKQPPGRAPVSLEKVSRGALPSLSSLLDTAPYLRPTSDIVALLVLQHQVTLHNEIVHANYKSLVVLYKELPGTDPKTLHWAQLPGKLQTRLDLMLRPLVDALVMVNAAPLKAKVTGSSGYAAWFQNLGPKDARGRSLRQLDLHTRVFRYPLSFQIYTEGFDALPLCVREHVYAQLAKILRDRDPGSEYNRLPIADRQAAFDILVATKPEFARFVGTLRD